MVGVQGVVIPLQQCHQVRPVPQVPVVAVGEAAVAEVALGAIEAPSVLYVVFVSDNRKESP